MEQLNFLRGSWSIDSDGNRVCIDSGGDGFDALDRARCFGAVDVVGVESQITRVTVGTDGAGFGVSFSPWFDGSAGEPLSVQVSDDAKFVAFSMPAQSVPFQSSSYVPVLYLRNTDANETRRIFTDGYHHDMTPDGRFILFGSPSINDVTLPDGTVARQLYRYDTVTQENLLVSQNIFGEAGNWNSGSRERYRSGVTRSAQISEQIHRHGNGRIVKR